MDPIPIAIAHQQVIRILPDQARRSSEVLGDRLNRPTFDHGWVMDIEVGPDGPSCDQDDHEDHHASHHPCPAPHDEKTTSSVFDLRQGC